MSRIHFVGGEKGGVGKSVVARLLAQYYIDESPSHSRSWMRTDRTRP